MGKENPLYEHYDRLLDIAREYDVTLSLGDGLRPGCLADATDKAQLHELKVLGELTRRAWAEGVQIIVEGPGHLPLNAIRKNVRLQQKHWGGAPFYVLGPLVTDVASGYDHIAGAIGGALAATLGAAFLCYVTPAEHLKLPEVEDVIEGAAASKIAAHAADIARGLPGAAGLGFKDVPGPPGPGLGTPRSSSPLTLPKPDATGTSPRPKKTSAPCAAVSAP